MTKGTEIAPAVTPLGAFAAALDVRGARPTAVRRLAWDLADATCEEAREAYLAAVADDRNREGVHPSANTDTAMERWNQALDHMVKLPVPDLAALGQKVGFIVVETMQDNEGAMEAIAADVARLAAEQSPDRGKWDVLLDDYRCRRALKVADEKYGPLALANLARKLRPGTAAAAAEEAALADHMTRHWEPWILAGLALVRAPAPDLEGVERKLTVMKEAVLEERFDDGETELFEIIRADVDRISRPIAVAAGGRAVWDVARAAYAEAKDVAATAPPQETPEADDGLCAAENQAFDALMAMPAPDLAAVIEKMRMVRVRYSDDGFATPDLHADQIEADIRRLARG